MTKITCEYCGAADGMHSMAYCRLVRDLKARITELEAELATRRQQVSQAFDAIDRRSRADLYGKHFTKYPCECGAMTSNSGRAHHSHLRGTLHRQNMERKALGLEPI